MATLKLQQKKSFSEQNMRKIINLIIGLQSSVSEASTQCLRDYIDDGSRTYSKGEICIFDGYIWECKSVTTGAFNPNSWIKLSDEFTQLQKSDIEAMINLSPEEISKLSDILLDTEVRLDKGWSSSCIYSKLQQCLEDSKTYTLKEISKLSGASYKVVTSTSEMTSKSIIYLLANATNYDMYIVEENGTATKIGNTDINLSQYLTKTEIETDYLKKTDADGKYATITTVDGKVDKTSIATAISSTPSNEKVASEKAVYDKNTINHKTIQAIDILDYASKVIDNFEFVRGFNVINSPYNDSASPNNDMLYIINRIAVTGYCRLVAYDLRSTFAYMKTQLNGTWTDWVRLTVAGGTEDYQTLATPQIKDGAFMSNSILWGTDRDFLVFDINKPDRTVRRLQFDTVEKAIGMYDLDYSTNAITEVGTLRFQKTSYVPPTNIAPADTTTFVNFKDNPNCNYCVRNGICYVVIWGSRITSTGTIITDVVLPKCANSYGGFLTGNGDATPHAYVFVSSNNSELCFDVKDANIDLYGNFSYPVAE